MYEMVKESVSGFGHFGAAEGDVLGTGCLCGGAGVCTTAKLQGPALTALRAAMRAAGIATSAGNWTVAEQNALNAFARAQGYPASSKFLVDGGPCQALKLFLAAPVAPPTPASPPRPIVDCASLIAAAPPVPAGTPVETVIAVLQAMAPAGFDVRACLSGQPSPVPVPTPGPSTPGPVIAAPPSKKTTSLLPILALGGLALLGLGGLAYVVSRPSMRKNGGRRRKRHHAATTPSSAARADVGKIRSDVRDHLGQGYDPRRYNLVRAATVIRFGRDRARRLGLVGQEARQYVDQYVAAAHKRIPPRSSSSLRRNGRVNLTQIASRIPDGDLRVVQGELAFWLSPKRKAMALSGPNRDFPVVRIGRHHLTVGEAARLYPMVMRRLDSTGWNNYPGMTHAVSRSR